MSSSKPGHRERFELTEEAIEALRAVLASEPQKLQRLEERLVRDMERAARRTALERKIALLKARNAALRAAAQPTVREVLEPSSADSALASSTSSTSPGYTVSPHDSTLTRLLADGPTRGPSPTLPAGPSSSTTSTTAVAAVPAASPPAAAADVDYFDETTMDATAPAIPSTWGRHKSVFRYAGPRAKGMVSSVIEGGVLYRIISDRGEWTFYNDTRYYAVTVRYRLLGNSTVTPGDEVTVRRDGANQELSMEVGPEETKTLLKGRVVDFENLSAATLLPKRAATAAEDSLLSMAAHTDWRAVAAAYPHPASAVLDRSTVSTEAVLAVCVDKQCRFVDPAFFPCHASLCRPELDAFYIAPLHWRSPSSYLPDDEKVRRELRLFRGPSINVDGLHAGHFFPDAVFLSCVIGLASHCAAGLRSLFFHPRGALAGRRERAVGAFRVLLCRCGWWESVVVDAFLPAAAACPEFSHCADDLRLLWLPYLQKAYAKLCGSYAATLDTPLEGVVGLLTGGPCCTLRELWPSRDDLRSSTGKAARFFATLKRLLRTPSPASSDNSSGSGHGGGVGYVCWLRPYSPHTARSQETRDKLERLYRDVGLAPGTATVVLGLETLEDGQCLVRLRQSVDAPRRVEEWLGVWRAAQKPWVESASDLAFAMDDVEGSVWMALEDVPQYFQSGYLSPLTHDWAVAKVQGHFVSRQPSVALQVAVTAPTRVLATVTQAEMSAEKRKASLVARESAMAVKTDGALAGLGCLVFASSADGGLRFVGSSGDSADAFELSTAPHYGYERDVSAGLRLTPHEGPYYVIPTMHANSLDVGYTLTLQAQASASPAAAASSMTVRFVELQADAVAAVQNAAKPSLRAASVVPCTAPAAYQTRSRNDMLFATGEGQSVRLYV